MNTRVLLVEEGEWKSGFQNRNADGGRLCEKDGKDRGEEQVRVEGGANRLTTSSSDVI